MSRDADRWNCSSAHASEQRAFNAVSFDVNPTQYRRRLKHPHGSPKGSRRHVRFRLGNKFKLVSTQTSLCALAKRSMLTSRASSLACPRQKPEWSSYGCKHPSRCRRSLPGVHTPGNQTHVSFREGKDAWQRGASSRRNDTREPYPSWSSFSFFCALFEWCVVVGRASCSGVTSLQSAQLRRTTDSAQRASCCMFSTATGRRGRHRTGKRWPSSELHMAYHWIITALKCGNY